MLPPALLPLFRSLAEAGGRPLLIGGCVRDHLRGRAGKDYDIEVHALSLDAVLQVLRTFGRVNEVGRAFGVLKLRCRGHELDVSLPRRDERAGVGHTGIRATSDPGIGVVEAARRRDLTVNAIAYDPLTDAYIDPFDGRGDIALRRLRAVDARTFGEDPLRALRVAQFAARFGFSVDPALEALCAGMPLRELPAERIRGEVEKLLLKGDPPSTGWEFAARAGLWAQVLPEWGAPQEALDRVAAADIHPEPRRLALLYAAACLPNTPEEAVSLLDRLRVFRVGGYPVRATALGLLARAEEGRLEATDARVRRLGEGGEVALLAVLVGSPALAAAAERLGVSVSPLPPLLSGRDLGALGVPPGPAMGDWIRTLREAQLAGAVADAADARSYLRRMLERGPTA